MAYYWEQSDKPPRRFLSTAFVATLLDVHPRTVCNLIARGRLRAVRVGHVWRIPPDALDAFLKTSK